MNNLAAKRIALYARVSTSKCEKCGKRQSDHGALDHEYRGQDSEVQLRELREYVERRGWQLTEIYTDSVSGTKNFRPGLDKLMGDAARRRFDVVVVWRFDRFARSVSHLLRALEQFQALGIDFISLSENVDTSTPTGKMIFTVLGAVAELERSLIVERVKAGLRNARAKGKKLGRPRADVRELQIEGLRASGASWRAIAKQTGLGVGTVHRIAQRRSKIPCGAIPCQAPMNPSQRQL
ncbi:MAG: recombinase family protein [Candidatus Sulfotelmatobacter sp.]